jgi:hypothetical protein
MDKELPDKQGLLLEMYDERAFSRDAIRELPDLALEPSAEKNLLHVQVAVLGSVVLSEARGISVRLSPKIFAFLEQALLHPRAIPGSEMQSWFSFVEISELDETHGGREVLQMMPPILKNVLASGAAYNLQPPNKPPAGRNALAKMAPAPIGMSSGRIVGKPDK